MAVDSALNNAHPARTACTPWPSSDAAAAPSMGQADG